MMLDIFNLFSLNTLPSGLSGDGARALPEAQIEAYQKANAHLMVNAKPSLEYILGLQNFKRPVIVPDGWSYWYSIADEGII